MFRPTLITVSLPSIAHNLRSVRDCLPPETKLMAVVKADGYGHGLLPVARAAVKAGADALGVSIPEEGAALRDAGIRTPILVLGGVLRCGARAAVEYDLIQTVYAPDTIHWLEEEAQALGKTVEVHLKMDTGMGRIGVRDAAERDAVLRAIDESPHVRLTGAFTHFSVADEAASGSRDYTLRQIETFREWVKPLPKGICLHAANSAATLAYPEASFTMVRAGILLYGVNPLMGDRSRISLWPTMRWETRVMHVKDVARGETLSYGRNYTALIKRRIATLPVGYGDGLHRCLSNRGFVLVRGKRAPIVGTICMDQLLVDVTETDAQVGDTAVLLGAQGGASITTEDMAAWAGTIPYEIMCGILPRVPRVYEGEA